MRKALWITGVFVAAVAATMAAPEVDQAPPSVGTATTLEISLNPSTAGQAVTFTARVALAQPAPEGPTGKVEFFDLDTSLGTGDLEWTPGGITATLSVSTLTAGPHVISAQYLGDSKCAASRSPIVNHIVTP